MRLLLESAPVPMVHPCERFILLRTDIVEEARGRTLMWGTDLWIRMLHLHRLEPCITLQVLFICTLRQISQEKNTEASPPIPLCLLFQATLNIRIFHVIY